MKGVETEKMSFKKGYILWNKGGHHSKKSREKMRQSKMGKKLSEQHKINIGKGNLGIPRPKSENQRKQISKTLKRKFVNGELKIKVTWRGKKFSENHRKNISKGIIKAYDHMGRVSPINELLRKSSKYKIWRELVFLRDNFTCQNLNCEYCHNLQGVYLHPHHIKSWARFPELRFKVDNGITYCKAYHINSKKLHKNISIQLKGGGNGK